MSTTIQIKKETHARLESIGTKGEDFNDIVERVLNFYVAYANSDIDRVHALYASLKAVAAQLVNTVHIAQYGYAKTPVELSPELTRFIDMISEGV